MLLKVSSSMMLAEAPCINGHANWYTTYSDCGLWNFVLAVILVYGVQKLSSLLLESGHPAY